ncbi:hypothetical protein [Natronosalvus rutilus]|uniref:DUF8156 domain-containing protein n=1 Tax=Natronosalvus rutilus TaxID=2953753 RepID=A0A9E7NAW9_9EURY|nr:hypothetical protein [Natronosalvus rutilus]UTF53302.1 hypothetical protein NGM29_16265 [Natronosalvus rutilus]
MGRTNPTYRDALRRLEADWKPMRRALRRERQADFDRLFERARNVADAAGYANPTDPEQALVLSLLVAHETAIRRLEARVVTLESALDALEAEVDSDIVIGTDTDTDAESRAGTGEGDRP